MREIVLDTETTGLDPTKGDRLVEIGCVELYNHIRTGQTYHLYLNPERDMPDEAFQVHGLSAQFLADKPVFADVVDAFLDYIGDARLVIHNAEFDMRFINAELARPKRPQIGMERVLDTLAMARRRHPGQPNSLDALCSRYGIDNSKRSKHGALVDAEILADVYAELIGGRQTSFGLITAASVAQRKLLQVVRQRPEPLPSRLTAEEIFAHANFVATLSNPIWNSYAAMAPIQVVATVGSA
jgi:DNA polymerase III subunit epsilon